MEDRIIDEKKLQDHFFQRYCVKDPAYENIFQESSGLLKVPYFNNKKDLQLVKGEREISRIRKLNAVFTLSSRLIPGEILDPASWEVQITAQRWYNGGAWRKGWELIVTSERILVVLKSLKMTTAPSTIHHMARWAYGIAFLRGKVMTIQQPLHTIQNIIFTEMVGEISDWRKPIQLTIQFKTSLGFLVIRLSGRSLRKFEKEDSLLEKLVSLKKVISGNKRFIVENLTKRGKMDQRDRNRFVESFGRDYAAGLDRKRIENGLYELHSITFTPLEFDQPIYAGDLKF